jgi:uncharacterized protein YigE (DUF2233 family)
MYSATIRVSKRCSTNTVRALRAAFLAGFALVRIAAAEWQVVSSSSEPSSAGAVEHRHVGASDSESGDRATIELAVFSSKGATLRVIDDADGSGTLAETMQREHCIAGTNGGYFDPDHAPVGLLIGDGRMIAPLRKARLLSGVVSVVRGRVRIERAAEFSMKTKPAAARQCGPFLVNAGKPIRGLNDTQSARRTFVATTSGDAAALGYCSSVTLAQLGTLLATPGLAPQFKVQHALNLDGGSSSGFWFSGQTKPFSIPEYKRVRDYIGIVAM